MSAASGPVLFPLWTHGSWPQVDVVGESHYETALRSLFPADLTAGVAIEEDAVLWPEPDNKYDPNAVAVHIGGQQVGYLSRDDAAQYQPLLLKLVQQSLLPQVRSQVRAFEFEDYLGTDRKGREQYGKRFSATVRVVLDAPHLCVPANLPPTGPHVVLPYGRAVQIGGEENHLDAITPLLGSDGETWAYVTLHPITEQLARSTRDVLEVRLDGRRAGQLTPKMSGEFGPAVKHLQDLGHVAAARAIIKGNKLKAEVTLHAARAHELDADWPNLDPGSSGGRDESNALARVAASSNPSAAPSVSDPTRNHLPIPPKPTRIRFNPPPGWPSASDDGEPQPGWMPPVDWPLPPPDWKFWIADDRRIGD